MVPNKIFFVFFILIFISIFSFVVYMIISSLTGAGRSRMMKRQLDISKKVLEDNKDTLMELHKMGVDLKKDMLEDNASDLKDIASMEGIISGETIEKQAAALKRGLGQQTKHCKYCGALIDEDSRFCKECGKEQ